MRSEDMGEYEDREEVEVEEEEEGGGRTKKNMMRTRRWRKRTEEIGVDGRSIGGQRANRAARGSIYTLAENIHHAISGHNSRQQHPKS